MPDEPSPRADGYEFFCDPGRIDLGVVTDFLSADAYWATWRTADDIRRAIEGAWRVVGCVHRDTGEFVAFARAISDGVNLAYLADVFVVAAHRGHGLGKRLVQNMIDDGPGADFRWLLHTADAHGLYAQFGFTPPDSTMLERASRRV